MKNNYEHITIMENIMNSQQETINKLEQILQDLELQQQNYQKLIKYYYSEQRNQDLEDDENNLIPKDLCRGVLSEDAIFDLMSDYRQAALHMLEVATSMLK